MTKISNQYSLTNVLFADAVNGRVGIGTPTPVYKLAVLPTPGASAFDGINVTTGSADVVGLYRTGSSYSYGMVGANQSWIYSSFGDLNILTDGSSTNIKFGTSGGTERMRITSAGNVGIGTSSPFGKFNVVVDTNKSFVVQDAGIADTIEITNYSTSGGLRNIYLSSASLLFGTGAAGGGNSSERMRITSGGNVLIGSSTDTGQGHILQITGAGRFTGSVTASLANFNNLGTGTVYSSGGILTSTNPSDKRLKKNIQDISYGLSDILKLKPVSYVWIDDPVNQGVQFGFIAQDVQSVMPDAVKEFGEEKHLGLEKDAIYATLVKAIQEQQTQINELKALLNA